MNKLRSKTVFGTSVFSLLLFVALLSPVEVSARKYFSKTKEDVLGWHPRPLGILGISCMECNCTYNFGPRSGERFWLFKSEPKIKGIEPGGPAEGKLRRGDVLVAVDGMLITTRKAGLRFANIKPGELVFLTVRRHGRMIDVAILPEMDFSEEEWEGVGLDTSAAESLNQWSKSIESLAKLSRDLSSIIEFPELPGWPERLKPFLRQELFGLPVIPQVDFIPPGWFGFNLSFSGTITAKKESGGAAQWQFDSPPEIRSVEPDSPADRAGLRPGDVLTHIDGTPLTSEEGERRFSAVQPGQTVEWTIKRDGEKLNIKVVAVERAESLTPLMDMKPLPIAGLEIENHELKFKGSLGGTDVEVMGDSAVEITEDKDRGEIVIKTRGATIRLRLSGKK